MHRAVKGTKICSAPRIFIASLENVCRQKFLAGKSSWARKKLVQFGILGLKIA